MKTFFINDVATTEGYELLFPLDPSIKAVDTGDESCMANT